MAQINIVVNTTENKLDVSINGASIPNVTDVSSYRDIDYDGNVMGFYVRITAKEVLAPDLVKIVEYYSYGSPQAQAAIADGSALYNDAFPDFVGIVAKSKVQKDIEKFLHKN